jgi:leucyl aminopeptidase
MSATPKISFAKPATVKKGAVVLLSNGEGSLSDAATAVDPAGIAERSIKIAGHKGRLASAVEVLAPEGSPADRIIVVGTGKRDEISEENWLKIGGAAFSKVKNAGQAAVFLEVAGTDVNADDVANFALGMILRSYSFDKYKTRKKEENGNGNGAKTESKPLKVTIFVADPNAARRAFAARQAIADGVMLARDLVNEPANVLGPVEFAAHAEQLEKLGVDVEILTEKELKKLGMGALLGVAQGSGRPPRLAVMQWKGGKAKDKPVAFVGKGVVFDTGGISIKPAAGMEDMKGDMGGAAAVTGVMHALAARKAKVNAVGIIGIVENMPDGNAQRPGDIVTSMSGQTIEVLNTDAEGRLVLADALWYCNDRFKPVAMINLATLTGAIIVALGNDHAGMFSNDDQLAGQLTGAGLATGEKVWRMPLGKAYDKLIDSKSADMKNIGGRNAGAITAAQFLQRFVGETPWAHLDVAGTAMSSPSNEFNQSWASGFGVRLLERFVRDNFE